MRDNNKYIDDLIESRLRKSPVSNTSDNFTSLLMKKVQAEGRISAEETKSDRIAKYIIGGFSSLIIGFTILIAYFSGSGSAGTSETTGLNISPALQTSNNYLEKLVSFIGSVFVEGLELIGLSPSARTISIALTVLGIICMFLLAERFLIRGRFKSSVGLK